jgi:hypothetical protein
VYLATAWLYESALAGLFGAATLAAFSGFAMDALGGPNAKTPAVLCAALTTAFLLQRRWFWGGFVAALATLVWQPMLIYAIVAAVATWVGSERTARFRALATVAVGAAIPVIAVLLYFIAAGAVAELVESALLLPATGTVRRERTLAEHLVHIVLTVQRDYGVSALLLWSGLLATAGLVGARLWQRRDGLRAIAQEPLIIVVMPPLLFLAAFSLVDFQGYDDAYPLLLYAAIGIAGVGAAAEPFLRGRATTVARMAPAAGLALLVAATLWWYLPPRPESRQLVRQRSDAAAVNELLGSQDTLYALGDPSLLVLTGRRNPSPNIFLSAGVDQWVVEHTPDGFAGWARSIELSRPDMIYVDAWITSSPYRDQMLAWIRQRFEPADVGSLTVFVTSELRERALR